ncbi:MAG: hypothetical protein RXO36_03475 [Candidatus Nanopusillus acidilobi]|jgi:hypothetical protein
MDKNIKAIVDRLIQALKTNKDINKHFNELLDLEAQSTLASLFIETIDTQDKSIDIQKELERVYNEIFEFISSKGYRTDILFLVLAEMKFNILKSNKSLMEISKYMKDNTLG